MKTKTLMVALATLLIGSLCFWACQKDEPISGKTDTTEHIQLKTEQVEPDCNTHCLNPDEEVYFEITDQQIISWGGRHNDQFSKTVDIVYYNTLTHFVLKVKSTNGIADILVDGESVKDFDGTIAEDTWHEITFPLAEDWQACDPWSFELQITGYGPPAYITVEYQLIGECADATVTDIEGNVYRTVQIGNQVWMAENLKTTKYRDGTPIDYPETDNTAWANNTTGAYAWYNNDIEWKDSYGALYNWHAVNSDKGLCPPGWHVPSDAEWTELVHFVVSQGYPNQWNDPNGAGNALKSTRTDPDPHPYWTSHSIHKGLDIFGFSALPGGSRHTDGSYYYLGYYGFWWSSSKNSSTTAWARYLGYFYGSVNRRYYNKGLGFSVRCVRDID